MMWIHRWGCTRTHREDLAKIKAGRLVRNLEKYHTSSSNLSLSFTAATSRSLLSTLFLSNPLTVVQFKHLVSSFFWVSSQTSSWIHVNLLSVMTSRAIFLEQKYGCITTTFKNFVSCREHNNIIRSISWPFS